MINGFRFRIFGFLGDRDLKTKAYGILLHQIIKN